MADVERRFHAFPSTLTAAFPPSDTRFLSALTLGVAYHGKHLTPASDLQRSFIQWCLLTWGGGGGVMWWWCGGGDDGDDGDGGDVVMWWICGGDGGG